MFCIVTGMHNSGTSILAKVVHENGIFLKPENQKYECYFFAHKNNFAMNGLWGKRPKPHIADHYIKESFEGWKEHYKHDEPCGAKDPRFCLMIEKYKEVFDPTVIYIKRDKERVALGMSRKRKRPYGVQPKSFWYPIIDEYCKAEEHADYVIKYEEMCDNPQEEFERLFDFLGMKIINRDVIKDVHKHV